MRRKRPFRSARRMRIMDVVQTRLLCRYSAGGGAAFMALLRLHKRRSVAPGRMAPRLRIVAVVYICVCALPGFKGPIGVEASVAYTRACREHQVGALYLNLFDLRGDVMSLFHVYAVLFEENFLALMDEDTLRRLVHAHTVYAVICVVLSGLSVGVDSVDAGNLAVVDVEYQFGF